MLNIDEPHSHDLLMRVAIVNAADLPVIERYLPNNYGAFQYGFDVVIVGTDLAGWTMKDYVIPRLHSGLYFPHEIDFSDPADWQQYEPVLGEIARIAAEQRLDKPTPID